MSQAGYILAINLLVAGLFAGAFFWVATYRKVAPAARWIVLGFLLGMASYGAEWLVSIAENPRLAVFASFALSITAFLAFNSGLARAYGQAVPWLLLGGILLVSLPLNLAIYEMPRNSFSRVLLYQAPYFCTQAIGAWIVLRARERRTLDSALAALLTLSSLHFLAKPFLATSFGTGERPQNYVDTLYAVLSQSMGRGTDRGLWSADDGSPPSRRARESDGKIRDGRSDRSAQSPRLRGTGTAAGRGDIEVARSRFDRHLRPRPFQVDQRHLRAWRRRRGHRGVLDLPAGGSGRQSHCRPHRRRGVRGGSSGRQCRLRAIVRGGYSQCFRRGGSRRRGHWPAASFGVAELSRTDTLSDMLRRADLALYEAKNAGRDCVRVALPYLAGGSAERAAIRET